MKLTKFTNKELDLITVGIINQFEHIEPIDKDYNVTYEIQEYGDHHIKVTFFWNIGCFEHDDEKVVTDNYYFIINKIEKLAQKEKEEETSFVIYLAWNCETKRGHVAEWNPILG